MALLAASLLVKDTFAGPLGQRASEHKRGLAYNDAGLLSGFTSLPSTKTSWAYNWAAAPGGSVPSGLEYVPMFWGLRPQDTSGWKAAADKALASGSKHLLGNNEPDHPEQAHLTPQACAKGWKDHMEQYAGKAKLIGPAITNGPKEKNMGLTWLGEFLTECKKLSCTIDAIAIHWYDSATNFAYFKKHVTDAHAAGGGRPIWITEFAGSGSSEQQEAFLAQALPFLDSLSYVERYAYFMASDGKLVSGKNPSKLGQVFATS